MDTKKKKILYISKDITFNGGGERMLLNLANSLADENDISILSLDQSEKKCIYEISDRIKVQYANIKRKTPNIITKFDYINYLKGNKNFLNGFDVIIGVGIICNIVLAYSTKYISKNIKTIGWEHFSYEGTPLYQKILRKILFKRLSSVVILTKHDYKKYYFTNKNTQVVYNFSNIKPMENVKRRKEILFVGRLSKQKGIKYLSKIISSFMKQNDDYTFRIIGCGPEKYLIDEEIRKGYIDSNRIFFQEKSTCVQKEMAESSCLIMTSIGEGLPMVLIEALICGLPQVSFDTETGPSDIIENGKTGYLIDCYNVEEFVTKLLKLVSDIDLQNYFSEQSHLCSEKFDSRTIIEQWKKIIMV